MKIIDTFAGQNWLITPAALALHEGTPADIHIQKWLLILSGVGIVDLKGESESNWHHETLVIIPDFRAALKRAVTDYAIDGPPGGGTEGTNYHVDFQMVQWAPFAAPSVMFNENLSNNSGFAVNGWRHRLVHRSNILTNTFVDVFDGIEVDVAVRDTDAWLHRVSYHQTMLGFIVFTPIMF